MSALSAQPLPAGSLSARLRLRYGAGPGTLALALGVLAFLVALLLVHLRGFLHHLRLPAVAAEHLR